MNCPNCNSEIKDGMKFCSMCGTEIPQTRNCFKCGTELKKGMCFCPKCGIRIVNIHNIPNDKYSFADNIERNNIIESANTQIQEVKTKMKKGLKYIAIGFACYLVLFLIDIYSNGGNNHYETDSETIKDNSNVIGYCKYCGTTITIDSPHECSNVCSRPSCKEKYDIYMSKSMFEHVNGKGSWDREVNKVYEKFSHP